jgi:hypothetical protein
VINDIARPTRDVRHDLNEYLNICKVLCETILFIACAMANMIINTTAAHDTQGETWSQFN